MIGSANAITNEVKYCLHPRSLFTASFAVMRFVFLPLIGRGAFSRTSFHFNARKKSFEISATSSVSKSLTVAALRRLALESFSSQRCRGFFATALRARIVCSSVNSFRPRRTIILNAGRGMGESVSPKSLLVNPSLIYLFSKRF